MGRRVAARARARRAVAALVAVLGLALLGTQLSDRGGAAFPDRPADAMKQPIGHPPQVDVKDSYRFVHTQPDSDDPVTYDPCAPIHLVVNDRTAVEGADRILREALGTVTKASGLEFVIDGPSRRDPEKELGGSDPATDGSGWRPVLVAWSDPDETPELDGNVAGVGGSALIRRDGHEWFVTGGVTLDGPQLATVLSMRGGRDSVRAVVMHELGHLVGLDHVKDRSELMFAKGSFRITDWGPGDRTGLAALGGGRCIDY